MIEAIELTKAYRKVPAVDGLSFAPWPGRVPGFLGPNALRQIGAVLEQGISHPGQSGRAHLIAQAAGVPVYELTVDTPDLEQFFLDLAAAR